MDSRAKREHGDLRAKVAENRAALQQVTGIAEGIKDSMEGIQTTTETRMDTIVSMIDATHTSVTSLRTLGEQIMSFIKTFPREMRDLLETVIKADWRTYRAVLQIQDRLAQSPSYLLESNIRFTNALGEYREYVIRNRSLQSEVCFEL